MAKGVNPHYQGLSGKVGPFVAITRGPSTILRERNYFNTSDSAGQRARRATIHALAALWGTLDEATIAGWVSLGKQMKDALTGRRAMSGYQAFVSVNATLAASGMVTVTTPPTATSGPDPLPPLLVQASYSEAGFILSVVTTAYGGHVQVYATAPLSLGRTYISDSAFTLLTTAPSLTGGANSFAAPYAAKYGIPAPGKKIALRLVPVSATGLRGYPIEAAAVVGANAAQAAAPADVPAQARALKAA